MYTPPEGLNRLSFDIQFTRYSDTLRHSIAHVGGNEIRTVAKGEHEIPESYKSCTYYKCMLVEFALCM